MGRVAGIDLGKATAKLVLIAAGSGEVDVLERRHVAHDGRPLDVLRDWYREAALGSCDALGVTGLHSLEVVAPAITGLPEDACLEAAIRARPDLSGPMRIVSVGARGYSVLARSKDGHVTWLENDKCSSGTGETIVKIAGRFGLGVEDADRLARDAASAIPITARCSVFAKSEMTHFGNQGRPVDQLFRGYFESVARIVSALLERARVDGPTYVVGGGSRIQALVDALGRVLGSDLRVPEDALFLEALGAAVIASEQARARTLQRLPADPAQLFSERGRRFQVLEPASRSAPKVRRLEAPRPPEGAELEPTVLGFDLGSTGSKAALTSVATGELVLDVYDRTRGNPVEAAQRLVASLAPCRPDVRAIAVTGSGREAVATVLRAAYPDAAGRVFVQNEIVAHATAAIRCDEDGGKSLSVVEIGGQDAKFIQIAGGQIVESDMNKACSAGTGSFLEEQAIFYGTPEIEEFTRLAQEAQGPPDLGQMCTVFVADAAAEAEGQGFGLADLFAGFQYSVIHNYKNRVMGERSFGERIFFQGKPATGPSLAWTLAAVTGREVVVPPNPGAMGAWGIGLCALDALGAEALLEAPALDLAAIPAARVVERGEIRCQDPRCATFCHIDRTVVAVGEEKRSVLSGGACPKFEISSAGRPKLSIDAPSPFDERLRLLAPFLADHPGSPTLGVPVVGALTGVIPWIATFLRELGLGVRVLAPDSRSLARGEERTWSYDACAPIKVAHGVADADVESLFFPKIFALRDREGPGGRTCAMEQALPEMVDRALRARGRTVRVHAPILDFRSPDEMLAPLGSFALSLGIDPRRVPGAARRARQAQEEYDEALGAIGDRALSYGRREGIPVVAVCGSLHVLHDPVVSAGIPGILRQNGVLPVPMDCFRIPDAVAPLPRLAWADASRAIRVALAARQHGDAYPLFLSSFGCGPASFTEHVFHALMEGHPHTALESDGHGGAAGYVTRVQAFLHAVRQHDGRASPAPADRLKWLDPLVELGFEDERGSRLVVLTMSDRFSPLVAAVYRSFGFDAVPSGPASAASLSLGRRDCSGKECLPYQLIWGSFRQALDAIPPGDHRRTVLLQVTGDGACRNCMFSVKDQISLDRLGLADRVDVRHIKAQPTYPMAFVIRLWATVVAWDILYQLTAYYRAGSPREVDVLYGRFCDELERLVARPSKTTALGRGGEWLSLVRIVDEAVRAFAALGSNGTPDARTVLLTGDVYVRLDELGSDGLARRLADRGMRVLVEPFSVLAEYVAFERSGDLIGLPVQLLDNAAYRGVMAAVRRALYRRVRPLHPWMPMPSVPERLRESRRIIARYPIGEAPITVGSVLHAWSERHCDGVVVVSPWGCGPALISESLLRHHRDIPMLFVYADGSPIDERRLNGFTFRLRQTGTRTRCTSS